jgi:hypothetical protein
LKLMFPNGTSELEFYDIPIVRNEEDEESEE